MQDVSVHLALKNAMVAARILQESTSRRLASRLDVLQSALSDFWQYWQVANDALELLPPALTERLDAMCGCCWVDVTRRRLRELARPVLDLESEANRAPNNAGLIVAYLQRDDWPDPSPAIATLVDSCHDLAAVGDSPVPDPKATPKESKHAGSRKPKADDQIIAALCLIHRYENGSVGNDEPADVLTIAKHAGVVKGTVSKVFKRWELFKSYDGYVRSCRTKQIGFHLKMLNREFGELPSLDSTNMDTQEID